MIDNQFVAKIKKIEDEILALKTASEYGSVRTSYSNSSITLNTGVYKILFGGESEPILSNYYIDSVGTGSERFLFLRVFARTPETNEQTIEINTTVPIDYGQSSRTYDVRLTILSNRPVISITRI